MYLLLMCYAIKRKFCSPTAMRQKATGALKSSFNDLLRRFSPYEDVQRAGFSSSKRDYLELIQYAQRVIANTQLFPGVRARDPDGGCLVVCAVHSGR